MDSRLRGSKREGVREQEGRAGDHKGRPYQTQPSRNPNHPHLNLPPSRGKR